jgi:ribosomal protein L40E
MDDTARSRAAQVRCLECGAEPAETAQVCVRCGAPAGLQQPVAAAPAAGPEQIRCLECGAEPAETAQVCVRCGAPVGLQEPAAAAPAAGGSGSSTAPLPGGVPGQRTRSGYSRRKALVVGGVGVTLAGALFTGLAVTNELSWDQTGSSTSSTTQPTGQQLRAGECLAGSNMDLGHSTPWPDYVTVVACTKRHEAEVFFAGNNWPQSLAYPGKAAVGSQSDACQRRPNVDPAAADESGSALALCLLC